MAIPVKPVLACVVLLLAFCYAETTARVEKVSIRKSVHYPGNILPQYLFLQGSVEGGTTQINVGGGTGTPRPFTPDDSVGPDIWEGAMEDMRAKQLPYLTQDQWGCEKETETFDAIVLENEYVKATIAPHSGGKLWALYDKVNKKDMIMTPKTIQFANIGMLKQWVVMGSENLSNYNANGLIGHGVWSESKVYGSIVDTARGPVVRVYEFDRYNATAAQVDFFLDGDELYEHPRFYNTQNNTLKVYHWSSTAFHTTPRTRVVAPADRVVTSSIKPMRASPWPYLAETWNASFTGLDNAWGIDHSFVGNVVWGDYFLRVPEEERHFLLHVEEDGYSVYHESPVPGQKVFFWGSSGNGRWMQDFMSDNIGTGTREGDYYELQTGIMPTQNQWKAFPAMSTMEWTEVFKPWKASATETSLLQHTEYKKAIDVTKQWINGEQGLASSKLEEMNEFFKSITDMMPSRVPMKGTSWGALETMLRKRQGVFPTEFGRGLEFSLDLSDPEVIPWYELVTTDTFSEDTLSKVPPSYQITEPWRLLLESIVANNPTWLHYYYLGVIYAEKGYTNPHYFETSYKLKKTAVCARSLALLCQSHDCAEGYYQEAWNLAMSHYTQTTNDKANAERVVINLSAEIAQYYYGLSVVQPSYMHNLERFLNEINTYRNLPARVKRTDQYLVASVAVSIYQGDYDWALKTLSRECFATYGRSRTDLIRLWNDAQLKIEERALGRPLTRAEQRNLRMAKPQPNNIGCPYAETYCLHYW